jgi:hypothetical protein
MSPVGRALHQQFERVCRSELERLRRKTAGLAAADRVQVDTLALEVSLGLAARLDAVLDAPATAALAPTVMHLFAVSPGTDELT